MTRKMLLSFLCVCVLLMILFFQKRMDSEQENNDGNLLEAAADVEVAMMEMDADWQKVSQTMDTPVTFSSDDGNTIIYHCLTTEFFQDHPVDLSGVDLQAVQCVIDPIDADSVRGCFVNEVSALLCTKGERAYLCWTLSPEYSFVIEYTSDAVVEEDIFVMAEDLQLP